MTKKQKYNFYRATNYWIEKGSRGEFLQGFKSEATPPDDLIFLWMYFTFFSISLSNTIKFTVNNQPNVNA
jgi:hypothetical protein